MTGNGKDICNELKRIRQQIADDNGIPLESHECHYEGPCKGTCPRCDAELHYLEREIGKKHKLGKAAIIAGITLSLAASCTTEGGVAEPMDWPEDTTQYQVSNNAETVDFDI